MEKLIIDNRTDLPMEVALVVARDVVRMGRISNNGTQYCYSASYNLQGVERQVHVSSFLNDKSDRLVVHYNDGIDHQED